MILYVYTQNYSLATHTYRD